MENIKNWKKNVMLYLIGQSVTLFGSMLVNYAVQWHITRTSQSGAAMTLFTLASALPMLIMSPLAGVWADRYNRKLLINIADAAIAAVTLVMALLYSIGMEYIALLLICAAARGFGQAVQTPAANSLVPELVPQEHLTRINGISGTVQSATTFAAPILAGLLIEFFPVQAILYIDVVTAAIGISILFFLVKLPKKEAVTDKKKSAWGDIREGLSYISKHAFIKKLLLLNVFFNFLFAPCAVLTPLQIVRNYGEESWRLVAMELSFFIGMALGGVLMSTWGGFKNKIYTCAAANILAAVSIIGLGLFTNYTPYLVSMALCGFAMSSFSAPMMTVMQTKIEPEYMGRVFSVMMMVSSLTMPISMMIWGPLADAVNINILLILSGAGILIQAGFFTASRTLRAAGEPAPKPNEA